jgi:N-acetylmuramoyl-L-alanine amidase
MRNIKYLVIHCTASPQSWGWQKLQWYFLNIKKWSREGYHVVVQADGTVKRYIDNDKPSNGVRPFKSNDIDISNSNSVHICWIGGVDSKGNARDNRTEKQRKRLKQIVQWYIENYPDIKILGHNQVALKACPCFNVPNWLKENNWAKFAYVTDNFNVLRHLRF